MSHTGPPHDNHTGQVMLIQSEKGWDHQIIWFDADPNLPSWGCNVKSVASPLSESSYETTCEISVSKIGIEHAGECHISMPIEQLDQDSPTCTKTGKPKQWALRYPQQVIVLIHMDNERQARWVECGKGGWDGVKEENIVFDKRHKVASSTSHKNVVHVPTSPPDIQPLHLSLCWAEVHLQSISCLSWV